MLGVGLVSQTAASVRLMVGAEGYDRGGGFTKLRAVWVLSRLRNSGKGP